MESKIVKKVLKVLSKYLKKKECLLLFFKMAEKIVYYIGGGIPGIY